VKTIIPDLDIVTMAVIVPTTLMHLHTLNLKLPKTTTAQEVQDFFAKESLRLAKKYL